MLTIFHKTSKGKQNEVEMENSKTPGLSEASLTELKEILMVSKKNYHESYTNRLYCGMDTAHEICHSLFLHFPLSLPFHFPLAKVGSRAKPAIDCHKVVN